MGGGHRETGQRERESNTNRKQDGKKTSYIAQRQEER